MRVAGLYLAAGRGSRMGGGKPSAELAPGMPLGRAGLLALLATELDPVIVAVREGDSLAWLPDDDKYAGRFVPVVCPEADKGLAHSLRAALDEALRLAPGIEAAVVALADQPMVAASDIQRYLDAFREDTGLEAIAGSCGGPPVPPVLWSRLKFESLARLAGDTGGRSLLREPGLRLGKVPLSANAAIDVDTLGDLAFACRMWTNTP
ncbi:nucleotidyltransferase family protein [Cohnella candidum]|uniref:Nucleotidyltransferase family protein n=1 Tax=Cohnella candidum TaxID=2674991 RepID=A0A3G3JYP1_9BACL|nr:nucleotidyltransferase family protein [Cohnella candidum]AYQ73376.1 nucleotidyltransferase family protein [Cohnella candidum]